MQAVGGRICQVQLVGNDGGQGGSCPTPSFSYKMCNNANGIDPNIPLGSDLSGYPDQGTIGGWVVGELVVVIGWTNACSGLCDGSFDFTGDWRWLVTKVQTPTDDFTSLYWQQFRCEQGIAFEGFLNQLIFDAANTIDCGQTPFAPAQLAFVDGCLIRPE